ncbi:glycosyltransferase family 9 protein [Thermostilla marina]
MQLSLPARPRILICRLTAIGDTIHTLPVLCALRERFPDAFLAWVVEGRSGDLLEGHRALDERIVVPRRWLKRPGEVVRLRNRLRALRFDIAIDVQGLSKSAVAAWLSGARFRIGFCPPAGREASSWLNNVLVKTVGPHVIDHNLQLLEALGIRRPRVVFDIPEDVHAAERVAQWLNEVGLSPRGYVIINPGAGWPSKLWCPHRFAEVAQYVFKQHGLPSVVVWAGSQEREWAETIVREAASAAILAPDTSLRELAALARRARLFVASDTGPLHIAAALGTRCVGLYGPMPAERNGPYGKGNVSVQAVRFEGTSRERRNAPRRVMLAVTSDMVCEACDLALRNDAADGKIADAVAS